MATPMIAAATLPNGITIGQIASLAELEEWQAVDTAIWQESTPSALLLTHQRYGGLLVAAREPAGHMIAILLGFPGLKDGRLVHCSHLLGVLPEWRSRDLGYAMKRYQREFVLAQGLNRVVWTFDPLETRNARLNIHRLGGICREYHRNLYGEMPDGMNRGLESDRLTVSWYIRHPAVLERLAHPTGSPDPAARDISSLPLLTRTTMRQAEGREERFLQLEDVVAGHDAPAMLIEVPANFQTIKGIDPPAARAWREGVRVLFQDLFARGYAALDMLRIAGEGAPTRCYYLIGPAEPFLADATP